MEQNKNTENRVSPVNPLAELDPMVFVRVLLSYWWILAPLGVLGAGLGLTYCFYTKPIYKATCSYYAYDNAEIIDIKNNIRSAKENPLNSFINLMKKQEAKVKLLLDVTFKDIKDGFKPKATVKITPERDDPRRLMNIEVKSGDPEYSKRFIEELLIKFKNNVYEQRTSIDDIRNKGYKNQIDGLNRKLIAIDEEITELKAENNFVYIQQKRDSFKAKIAKLLLNKHNVETERVILESQFSFLQDADPATLIDVLRLNEVNSQQLMKMNSKEAVGINDMQEWRQNETIVIRLEKEYKHLLLKYKEHHPKMVKLQEKLETAKREIKIQADLMYKRLLSRKNALEMQANALQKAAEQLESDSQKDDKILAEYEGKLASKEQITDLISKKMRKMEEQGSINTNSKYILQNLTEPTIYADLAGEPIVVWPIKWQIAGLGSVISMAIGGAFILLIFIRRIRLYNYDYIESVLHIPCLAGIPRISAHEINNNPMFLNELPKSSAVCESYRTLRTSIEQLSKNAKLILVTSPEPSDGKTFTTINIANVFSWTHKKVLIVDGDFRRVSLRKAFPNAPKHGLIDALAEEKDWKQFVVKDVSDNLDYLPAGMNNDSATELINTPRFDELMNQMRHEYDIVIIDTAPVGRVVDTILMAQHVEAVVLVGKLGKTSSYAIRYAINRLGKANLIGFVQNRITDASRKYNYYQGGSYSQTSYYASQYQNYYAPIEEDK